MSERRTDEETLGALERMAAADDAEAAEIARIEAMSPEETRRRLAARGVDLASIDARAEALKGKLAAARRAHDEAARSPPRAAEQAAAERDGDDGDRGSEVAVFVSKREGAGEGRPSSALFWLIAAVVGAALAAGGAVAAGWLKTPPDDHPSPLPPTPSAVPVGPSSDAAARAASLRRDARIACDAQSWQSCMDKLDAAKAIDPAGDEGPAVQSLRASATAGLSLRPSDKGGGDKGPPPH